MAISAEHRSKFAALHRQWVNNSRLGRFELQTNKHIPAHARILIIFQYYEQYLPIKGAAKPEIIP